MSALLWRILIAVLMVVLLIALLPPVFRLIGFPLSGDLLLVLKIVIAGLAILYVFKGPPFPPIAIFLLVLLGGTACASVDRFNAVSASLVHDAIVASEEHRCTVHAEPCLDDAEFKQTNAILNKISVAGVTFTNLRISGAALPKDITAFLVAVSSGITDLATAFPNGDAGAVLRKLSALQTRALDLLPE